jgi:uncharacterized protein YkwD
MYHKRFRELLNQEKAKVNIPPYAMDPVGYKKAYDRAQGRAKTRLIQEYKGRYLDLYRGAITQGYTTR